MDHSTDTPTYHFVRVHAQSKHVILQLPERGKVVGELALCGSVVDILAGLGGLGEGGTLSLARDCLSDSTLGIRLDGGTNRVST